MRFFSIVTAVLVSATLYLLVFEREAVLAFAEGGDTGAAPDAAQPEAAAVKRVSVVVMTSRARMIEQAVLVRGRTEAARQVDVRAETSGAVISEPLRKGAFVAAGDLLCSIDPGTREVSLAEAEARLAEARARLPEAEARLAEARARLPESDALIIQAGARVPEAEARSAEARAGVPAAEAGLAEARARVPEAEARLAEARARVPEAEARVAEAEARVAEAEINLNAATSLARDGFASDTRVAAAQAAAQTARAGLQSAKSQLEGAKAGVQAAKSQVQAASAGIVAAMSQIEGARAGVQSANSQIEGASAGVISAKSQLEGARAGVQSAKSGVESARSGIQSAEAGVAVAKKEIERLTINAPFAGLMESDAAELGELLQPGGLCATIIQLDPIKLVGFIPEIDVDKVKLDARAGSTLASGREVMGKVTFLSRSADPTTRTFRVEVTVPNEDLAIRDGQTAEIYIQAEGQSAHLIPQSALTLDDNGQLGVRIVDARKKAGFLPVTVLRDTVQGIYVSGLGETADIIVVGQEFVTEGVDVAPTYRETPG